MTSISESYTNPTISLDSKEYTPSLQKLRKPSISLNTPQKVTKKQKGVKKPKVSKKAKKLVESITGESSITKAINEADQNDSISSLIRKEVKEESNRLDKIAELEAQLAELKSEQKDEQTYDSKSFKEVITKDIQEYIEKAEDSQLVELYNTISDNEAVYNEESSSILIKTPETSEIIADAEKQEAPDEAVVQEKEPQPEAPIETEDEEPQIETDSADEYTNDLDPQDK